jgi:hypothetical protein
MYMNNPQYAQSQGYPTYGQQGGGQFATPPSSELVNVSATLQLPQNISRVGAALSRDLAGQIALFTGNPGLYGNEYSQTSIIGSVITPGFSLSSWGTPEQGGLSSNPTTASFPGFFQPISTFPSLRRDGYGYGSSATNDPRYIPQGWVGGNSYPSGQGSYGGYGMPQSAYGSYNMNPYAQTGGYGMDPYAQTGGYGMPYGYGGSYSPMPQPYSPY